MPTILCVDDSTFGLSHVIKWLSHNGYFVLGAADAATALAIAGERPISAVLLNCHGDLDNAPFVAALRNLQPGIAVIMFSGYCDVPCRRIALADACVEKGDPEQLMTLRAVPSQRRYGLCRTVAAA
jgi:CheY-like chemotaxis protein